VTDLLGPIAGSRPPPVPACGGRLDGHEPPTDMDALRTSATPAYAAAQRAVSGADSRFDRGRARAAPL
jgi:hypothetical protein